MDKMRKTINNLLFRAGVAAVFAVVGYLGFDMHGFSVFFLVFVFFADRVCFRSLISKDRRHFPDALLSPNKRGPHSKRPFSRSDRSDPAYSAAG